MAREVVEVSVRLGPTIIAVTRVGAGQAYRIGTAADVDLAVAGHTRFPLVEDGAIRIPLGVPAHSSGATTELALGGVVVRLTHVRDDIAPLARPRLDARFGIYVAGALLVHLGVWLAAILSAPLERLASAPPELPRLRHMHVAHERPEPPAPRPRPVRAAPVRQTPSVAGAQPSARAGVETSRAAVSGRRPDKARAHDLAGATAKAVAGMARAFDKTRVVERVGALQEEDNVVAGDEYEGGFGSGRRFDPGVATIQSGDYEMMLHDVKLCPRRSCTVRGPVPALYVRTHLHEHMAAIYACYDAHATGPGTIVLEFTIAGDGSVRAARGSGLGETGECAARVLPRISFKAIGDNDVAAGGQRETHVRYPIQFEPRAEG